MKTFRRDIMEWREVHSCGQAAQLMTRQLTSCSNALASLLVLCFVSPLHVSTPPTHTL